MPNKKENGETVRNPWKVLQENQKCSFGAAAWKSSLVSEVVCARSVF